MSGVMFQYGRNTTVSMKSANTGVVFPSNSSPTITFIVVTSPMGTPITTSPALGVHSLAASAAVRQSL
jgi:hypothetical protein